MTKLFTFAFLILFFYSSGQISQPVVLSLQSIGGSGSEQVISNVTTMNDGGFIVHIETNSAFGSGNIDSFCVTGGKRQTFIKYNSDASIIDWSKCYDFGGDSFLLYLYPAGSNVVIGGLFNSASGWGFLICKHDGFGNVLWQKNYSKGNGSILRSMTSTDDGGFIMTGDAYYTDTNMLVHYGSWGYQDIWVLKVDSNGNKEWSKIFGGTDHDMPVAVISAPGGGCYVVGTAYSSDFDCIGNHGMQDIFLAKLDIDGNIAWKKLIGGSGTETARCAATNGKGGVIIGGTSNSLDGDRTHFPASGCPIWALEVDSNGNIVWNKCFGGGTSSYPLSICKSFDRSVWIAGTSTAKADQIDTSYGYGDALFVHADSTGNFLNAKVLGSNQEDRAYMVHPLANGNVIGGGFFGRGNGAFSSTNYYGAIDGFLTIFAPWNQTKINDVNFGPDVLIYPNPAKGLINFKTNQTYKVVITDIIGRQIFIGEFKGDALVQTNGWQAGVYYAKFTGEGWIDVQKIIMQ